MNYIQTLQSYLDNTNTYGISINGNTGSGKTSLIKDIIKKFKETSFRINDDIIILSNKTEYKNEMYISTSHVKLSPIMLKGFLLQCVSNHKIPNLIIDNTHSLFEFKRLFKAIYQLPQYSLTIRTVIFDDLTCILPENLYFRSLHDIIPIFIFQNTNFLSRNSKEMILTHCNESITLD